MADPGSPAGVETAVTVVVSDEQDEVEIDADRWAQLAGDVLRAEHRRGELTLTFVDRAEMALLNAEHMGQPGPTDVLSFPLDSLDDDRPDVLSFPLDSLDDDRPDGLSFPLDSLDDDRPDVLSFPLDSLDDDRPEALAAVAPVLLGDIVICPAVAAEAAPGHAGTIDDEIALLTVHGVLHVLGHDHDDPEQTRMMRRRELDLLMAHHWRGPAPVGFVQEQETT